MRDKDGNELTTKEFMQRWGEGIQKITPFQQTKISLIGVILVFIGVCTGVVVTFMSGTWWLFIILLGSFLLTAMSLLGTIQKYIALKKIDEVLNPKNKLEGGFKDE